jgi:hypothetical protein
MVAVRLFDRDGGGDGGGGAVMKVVMAVRHGDGDNPNTQQTPEYTKDKYNVKIMKRKVSPKVSPTTCVGRRLKERRSERGEGTITK